MSACRPKHHLPVWLLNGIQVSNPRLPLLDPEPEKEEHSTSRPFFVLCNLSGPRGSPHYSLYLALLRNRLDNRLDNQLDSQLDSPLLSRLDSPLLSPLLSL